MRYRRKGGDVTAIQFDPDAPWPAGVELDPKSRKYLADLGGPIKHKIDPGDWLVTFDNGATIRIKPDLFPKMFDPIQE